jgi:dynein heavy chain 1
VRLYGEKREELEEEQRHLHVGLEKLQQTVVEVEELRLKLAEQNERLDQKSSEANQKLKQMLANQQQAEQKRAASLNIRQELEDQTADIESRKRTVMADLAEAEPAVLEAQRSVSGIKKQHLTEVRSMVNPPVVIKLAMESVCCLLNHSLDGGWRAVQQIIRRDDFISNIVNYDTERMMTAGMRERMRADYLSHAEFNFESVNRASKACGPLVQWVIAQVKQKYEPLKIVYVIYI